MIKILFVCHGNICRSPMAEFVMKKLVRDISSSAKQVTTNTALTAADFEIASAATSTEEIGNPVYPPTRRMLDSHGIDCSGKTARQMTVADYNHYDYIVLMDQNNLRDLRWILPVTFTNENSHSIKKPENSHNTKMRAIHESAKFRFSWIGRAKVATLQIPGTQAISKPPGKTSTKAVPPCYSTF